MNQKDYVQLSGPLFEAVQLSAIFPDSKTFVDSWPNQEPQTILELYLKEKDQPGFDLKDFVLKHFTFPQDETPASVTANSMEDYIYAMWDILEKEMSSPSEYSTLIPLPKPHIVPGGRFRECFYWDSYFTAIGLIPSGQLESIKNMVENFAQLIDQYGFIPNGNRVYFASRSQPPYFSFVLKLLYDNGENEWALDFFPQLEAEYRYWMTSNSAITLDSETTLNRYTDALDIPRPEAFLRETELAKGINRPEFFRNLRAACASGWDFSSRFFEDSKRFETIWAHDLLPVDLNCLLYHLEQTLSQFAHQLSLHEKEAFYQDAATKREQAIQKVFWDEEKGFFFDYNFQIKKLTKTWSLAAATPLFCSVATKEQGHLVSHHLKERFLMPGGFTTSLYEGVHQWDMPNGWAPLQWITVVGLMNYGMQGLAKEASENWLNLCEKIYKEKGSLFEKYNVRDCSVDVAKGEYELQEGFGWTNGVVLALRHLIAG